jgi:FkbM family methyltransferase
VILIGISLISLFLSQLNPFLFMSGPYKPSLLRINKYLTYADYLKEFIACRDFKSLKASFKYVMTHKGPAEDYEASSKMGTFLIRKGTNDFQFINKAYERKVKEFIQDRLDTFDVFIDVGACIGEYCVWLAKEGKRCIAVEPVNFRAIEKNIRLNKLEDRIQLFPCGLGTKKERVHFNIPDDVTSSSYRERNSSSEPNVDIDTLDAISEKFNIRETDRILIKLDVEGMESEVIEGGKNFIAKYKNLTFIYEDFVTDDFRNDKALQSIANFTFSYIDEVNRLAVKS